jgi:hypothetical protein
VSQLISPITGALAEEEDNGDEVDGCNEESSGGATIQVMPRPINTAIMTPIPTITHFFDFIAIKEGLVTRSKLEI